MLQEYNISWKTDIIYFRIDGNIANLYYNGEDIGFVDLCGDEDLEFKKLLCRVTGVCVKTASISSFRINLARIVICSVRKLYVFQN